MTLVLVLYTKSNEAKHKLLPYIYRHNNIIFKFQYSIYYEN